MLKVESGRELELELELEPVAVAWSRELELGAGAGSWNAAGGRSGTRRAAGVAAGAGST